MILLKDRENKREARTHTHECYFYTYPLGPTYIRYPVRRGSIYHTVRYNSGTKVISHPLNPLVVLTRDNKQTFLAPWNLLAPQLLLLLFPLSASFLQNRRRRLSRGNGSPALYKERVINY